MDSLSSDILPNGSVVKYEWYIYEIWWHRTGWDSKLFYLVTSSIWGWALWEIEDSDNLLLRDGEKRIHRAEFRPDSKENQDCLER